MILTAAGWFQNQDVRLCRAAQGVADERMVLLMRLASAIGDGWLWASLAAGLYLTRPDGMGVRYGVALCVGALLGRGIKHATGRDRPFATCADIRRLSAPLDRYSFPSGHTLHAFLSATVLAHVCPAIAPVAWLMAAWIGASRVVLGFHYPTDVAAGALLGGGIGLLAISL